MAIGKLQIRLDTRRKSRHTGTIAGIIVTLLIFLTLIGVGSLSGCQAGQSTRERVLFPVMRNVWILINQDVAIGIGNAVSKGHLDKESANVLIRKANAVTSVFTKTSNVQQVSLTLEVWPDLEPYALRGIALKVAMNVISAEVGVSRMEMVKQFTLAVSKYKERLQ